MRLSRSWLCAFFVVATVLACFGTAAAPAAQLAGGSPGPLSGELVIEGANFLLEGQSAAAEKARRANPEAIAARSASETTYRGLGAAAAEKLAGESFPGLIDDQNGGSPRLPSGSRITGYSNAFTAHVALAGGEHALVQSTLPIASEISTGHWMPLDLGLRETDGGFDGTASLVDARLPKRLSEGAQLPSIGLSVTPVDAHGAPLAGSSGAVDGASVFVANTLTDSDSVLKPSTFGFSIDTLLRSANSPEEISFKVGLPAGAHLVSGSEEPGSVLVVKQGSTIAHMSAPSAVDAAGAHVPVSVRVSGDVVTLTVTRQAGEYQYPVEVDPEFNVITESRLESSSIWPFTHEGEFSANYISMGIISANYTPGQWGAFNYATKGNSKIYEINAVSEFEPTQGFMGEYYWLTTGEDYIEIAGSGGTEGKGVIAKAGEHLTESPRKNRVCAVLVTCALTSGTGNTVRFVERATGTGTNPLKLFVRSATVSIAQPSSTHSTVNYASTPEIEYVSGGKTVKAPNVLYGGGAWLSSASGAFEFASKDAGLGVSATSVEVLKGATWEKFLPRNYLIEGGACVGIQCGETQKEVVTYSMLGSHLVSGYNTIRVSAHDPMSATSSTEHGEGEATLKVDNEVPHGITLTGLAEKSGTYELDETAAVHAKVEASDGEGSTPSSGIKSITLGVDGKEIGTPVGTCTPGPCTGSGEWTINGGELGSGAHTLTVVVTDGAGNVTTKKYSLGVYHAGAARIGPGSVNTESGNFALGASDVKISGGMGALEVNRNYNSRNVVAGAEGPLGPQWAISLGSMASLTVLPDKSVIVSGPEGGAAHFVKKESGGFEAPPGDTNLKLEAVEVGGKITAYLLKDPASATSTRFTLPAGAKIWMPTVSEGPVATSTTTDEYTTAEPEAGKKIVEPILEVAPHPSATCSYKKLEKGCRALEFNYAASTTATGESESEWGDYKGRLTRVYFIAWDPSKSEVTTTTVAQYSYDTQGRLRAEWDPRVSPALKTIYGYDSEGHVTALTPAGQETWAFTYGAIAGDATAGRLLRVTRAPASESLWGGTVVKSTETPTISGSPVVGVRMGVSNGKWSGSPMAYGYQWEDCNTSGAECKPIVGANNANYTPVIGDIGHKLVALVTATSGGGSVATASTASGKVGTREYVKYGLPGGSGPSGAAIGPDGNMWFTDYGSSKIGKVTPAGVVTEYGLPASSGPGGIVAGPDGNMWFADWGTDKIGKITTSGSVTEYALPAGSNPKDITVGSDNNLWFTDWTSWKVGKITTSGVITEYSVASNPDDITKGPDGNLWFTMPASGLIGVISTSGAVGIPYSAGSEPYGIVTGSDGNLWFADHGNNKVGKITTGGTVTEYALTAGGLPMSIAASPDGNLYVTEYGSCQIAKVTTGGSVTEYEDPSGSEYYGSGPNSIVYGPDEDLWVANSAVGDILRFNPGVTEGGISEATKLAPTAGFTMEYNVPVSGSGAPYAMSAGEVAKWGQTDKPSVATAIFPPDEPQTWPASDYKRATVYYMDSHARNTNVAGPGGAITTTEYNEYNDIVRTLSAANRATAMSEWWHTEEVAKLLDTESVYSEEGTELIEKLGPQHTVKIAKGNEKVASGSEVLAREHTKYYYDEGAPGTGEIYDLVTKTTDGAETASKEELDVRTTTTSYSGQSNFGWELREPTSTTVDPSGLKITHTIIYDEATGRVLETRGPASAGAGDSHDGVTVYYSSGANSSYPACGGHIEWTGLLCETLPGKQPETSGLPALPVTTTAYNIWDQAETITETFGSTTRTKKTTFDSAGRPVTTEVTSTNDTAVPAVTNHYDEKTGALVKKSESFEGKEKAIALVYDRLGEIEYYFDSDGGLTVYKYDIDGRTTESMIYTPGYAEMDKQTYTYDTTTGFLTNLADANAGTFTATYNVAGQMMSATYPNKMTASYIRNAVGEGTGIEYKKTAFCATSCPEKWSSDTIVPSIHGEALKESGTLGEEPKETYDEAGRLTEVQEIPTGQGCKVRIYAYDIESNRTSLTSRAPGAEGKCASEGGSVEAHTYDSANRLTDSGVTYETFGNITKVPAADAGGAGMEITSSYYADNQLATQEQNGKTSSYYMDPDGRLRETRAPGVSVTHYAGPGSGVAWVSEPESKWTSDIPGIDGSLSATKTNAGTVTLLLHDLQGNTIGTAALDEKQTKLLTTYKSTEFGVPVNGAPPKYAWLGGVGIASESTTGLVVQQGVSYVPQTGQALQTQGLVVPDPDNAATPYVNALAPWVIEGTAAMAKQLTSFEEAEHAAKPAIGGTSWEAEGEEGGGASISSAPSCETKWKMLEESGGTIWMSAGYYCPSGAVAHFNLTFCIDNRVHGEKTWYEQVCETEKFENERLGEIIYQHGCIAGDDYTATVKGREWSNEPNHGPGHPKHPGIFFKWYESPYQAGHEFLTCKGPDPGEIAEEL